MPDSYAYIISNNKIEPILSRVRSAAKPERFSRETLATWGFTASNDRAMVSVMKGLGFLTDSGAPTEHYDRLRDPNDWRYVLGERVRAAYPDLFAIDANMNSAPETEVKGAMLRITGKDEETVSRYYATFKTLASLAKFEPKLGRDAVKPAPEEPESPVKLRLEAVSDEPIHRRRSEYHYNIQIHLPVTTDITVYNAIFKSLKENLGV
ncbi:DUF5343 domain-containing protein [Xylophilus sp. GW821-FHT01B05]